LAARYAARLALAHLLACGAATAIVIPLGGITAISARAYFTQTNIIAAVASVIVGTACVVLAGIINITPTLRWFVARQQPTPDQRRSAKRIVGRQSAILSATWGASGALIALLNIPAGAAVAVPTTIGVVLGASAAVGTALLLTQGGLRPILTALTQGSEGWITVPSVQARMVLMWVLCSFIPAGAIGGIIFVRANGWIIANTAPIEMPILVVAIGAVLLGMPLMFLTSRSIADPLGEVVDAMAKVEQGELDVAIGVYERSEIGRLQSGFNRMVAGLAERERLHDLFGRYVGEDVARRAIEEGVSMSGDVRDAAVLYIDLVGSTQFAANRPPQQVADVLNDFFRIVVETVDKRDGLINKFEGDAALAIFGAPLSVDNAASSALVTARDLGDHLQRLPLVDFGIGISAGQVFAGNIGAENRYEYTVIGDPVNEAARLADRAKASKRRILASSAAIERAESAERERWAAHGSEVLRGRSEVTHMSAPAGSE
jgi:class 3 adenylate cyclase